MDKKKKAMLLGIPALLLVLAIAIYFVITNKEPEKEKEEDAAPTPTMEVVAPTETVKPTETPTPTPTPIDEPTAWDAAYEELYKQNSDIVGWMYLPGTKLDYPLMYVENDSDFYYLYRNFFKGERKSGTPFLNTNTVFEKNMTPGATDTEVLTDPENEYPWSTNIIIYGHNMRKEDGRAFTCIMQYKTDETFREENPYIYVNLGNDEYVYQIVCGFNSIVYESGSDAFKYYTYNAVLTEAKFNEYVEGITGLALFNTGVDIKWGDNLITLSTCDRDFNSDSGKFVLVAKRLTKEETTALGLSIPKTTYEP